MNKSTAINMILEFVDNGAILEYPDQGSKYVVEGEGNEPYNSIGEDIKQAITGIEVSNRYRISITIEKHYENPTLATESEVVRND